MPMNDNVPPEMPPHWLVYFAVDDCDAAVKQTEETGGRVIVSAMDIDPGRFAVLSDPNGAAFAVIKVRG
jgi:predicted enzyme related to lactoylglutathione lyase